MIFDHIGIGVASFPKSRAFYLAALAPLGIGIVIEDETWAMFGRDGKPAFWIGEYGAPPGPFHLAFAAASRDQVRAFHRAAIAAGARDNGVPGLRPEHHPAYFAAYVYDPDGHNVEAVCHRAE